MGLEANVVYLEEEIAGLKDRIGGIKEFLRVNPSVSIYHRNIKGKVYYYKKFRKGEKSVSEFLGNNEFDFRKASGKLKVENEKVKKAKVQLAKLRKELVALQRQARIARRALEHVRI